MKTVEEIEKKFCKYCKKERSLGEFHKHCTYKDGLDARCKQCASKKKHEYFLANRERVLKEHYARINKRPWIKYWENARDRCNNKNNFQWKDRRMSVSAWKGVQ